MGSGITTSIYDSKYDKLTDIGDIKRYFIVKDLREGNINLPRTLATHQLTYTKKYYINGKYHRYRKYYK